MVRQQPALSSSVSRPADVFMAPKKAVESGSASGGASQPAFALQPLQALNRTSSKVAIFAFRPCGGRVTTYSYKKKGTETTVTAYKFEVWIVGINGQEYCIGQVKDNEEACQRYLSEYTDNKVGALSKVVFDTYTAAQYISTPISFRVDLAKSTVTWLDISAGSTYEALSTMPKAPVPPRTVADVKSIKTNKSMDVIAMVKDVSGKRTAKSGCEIVDVVLVDNSEIDGKMVSISVSVFGADKVARLKKDAIFVFFNLTVSCASPTAAPTINHYESEIMVDPSPCEKLTMLQDNKADLVSATDMTKITGTWTPAQQARDVSGPQPLSCTAFLDLSSENPHAKLPEVSQLMWVHLEEPEAESEVTTTGTDGERIWFVATVRDISGSTRLGIPQRCALPLAKCDSKEDFIAKHERGELNTPLLCQVRVSRVVRPKDADGASQPSIGSKSSYVNTTIESIEPVTWEPSSAPNAAFTDILSILKICPASAEGIQFAFLADVHSDPQYGFRLEYDGVAGPTGTYVACLVASTKKPQTEKVGEDGYKVTTTEVKDIANPMGSVTEPVGSHTLVGYCSMDGLSGFSLDPPRNKTGRFALVLFSSVDDNGVFIIHKLEALEKDQIKPAVACLQKLRTLSKRVVCESTEKRSRSHTLDIDGLSPCDTKKARVLHASPTEGSLPDQ